MNFFNIWACEPNKLIEYLEHRAAIDYKSFTEKPEAFGCIDNVPSVDNNILSIEGDTATIEIVGILNKEGPDFFDKIFGIAVTGYNQIIAAAQEIAENDSVKKVILKMDTPGGLAIGVDEAFQAINSLEQKVIAENHGMIASAGYWLAVSADEIVSTSPTNLTGSIGVKIAGFDPSKAETEFGIKRVVIVSENAPEKDATLRTKKGIATLQKEVNAIERVFFDRISGARNVTIEHIKENFGQGAVFVADDPGFEEKDAISVNMIDGLTEQFTAPKKKQPTNFRTEKGKKELLTMDPLTLAECFNKNPVAKTEHESIVKTARKEAAVDARKELIASIEKRMETLKPFIEGDVYGSSVRGLALKALTGSDAQYDSFVMSVSVKDAQDEKGKSAAAQKETDGQDETLADSGGTDKLDYQSRKDVLEPSSDKDKK